MKKTILYTMLLLTMFSMVSCDAWLTLEPEDGVTRKDFWQNKEQVQAGVVGIYCAMMNTECISRMFLWGELRADMVTGGTRPRSEYTAVIAGEIASENSVARWSSFYSVINACNLVLDFADQAVALDASYSQTEADLFKAEAKALRGLMYFYLLRSFGEVPLKLTASVSDNQKYDIKKSTQEEVMKQIIKDLTEAETTMFAHPSYNMEYPKGRMTVWAVKAILADVYLWNEDYSNALLRCDAIIRSERFLMIPVNRYSVPEADSVYYANLTDVDNLYDKMYATGNSDESIFELNFDETKTNGFYSLFSSSSNVLIAQTENLEGDLFPLYEADVDVFDIRSNSYSYKGSLIWKYQGLSRSGLARTSQQSYANWIFYRYTDVLLMKAEILIQQGSVENLNEAYTLIRQVRERANALESEDTRFEANNISASDLERLLLDERCREFLFEGKRWYDVLRFAKRNNYAKIDYLMELALKSAPAGKQQSLQAKYGDHRSHYWPIHDEEMKSNMSLVQNAFYETTTLKK